MKKIFILIVFILTPYSTGAAEIKINPENPIQGEPVLVTVSGVSLLSNIKSATLGKQPLNFFLYQNKISSLASVDLLDKVGTTSIKIEFKDDSKMSKDFLIKARPKIETSFEIPKKLGGNTKAAAEKLVSNLVDEQASVKKIMEIIKPKAFWKEKFVFPVKNPIVTDNYGYSRDTLGYSIAHKGTDFKASVGTPVLAINRGVVRDNKTYPTFGRTVIVDHGFGLYSMYLHLSKIKVNVGELVLPGQVIGFSGDSGYATGPHLHLTIRINGVSIDPIKFYELFGVKI